MEHISPLLSHEDLAALRPDIVECSYNPHPDGAGPSVFSAYGMTVLRLPCTFNPTGRDEDKSPDNAWKPDPNWDLVLRYHGAGCLKKVVLFLGLIRSGSIAIAERACRDFAGSLDVLDFVMCDHDQLDKLARLFSLGIAFRQMSGFWDANPRCKEWDHCDARARSLARALGHSSRA